MYGTLRPGSGHPMARFLADHTDRIGPATLRGEMLDLGGYPGAVALDGGEAVVQGEVLRLRDGSILHHVDGYEGSDYERGVHRVELWDGSHVDAWVYVFRGSAEGKARVPGGNWLAGE